MEIDKKLLNRIIVLLMGIALITLGTTQILIDLRGNLPISDEQVIERAKALGMVEMKDVYNEDMKDGKLDLAPKSTQPTKTEPTTSKPND